MKKRLFDLLICPECAGALAVDENAWLDGEIESGELKCAGCGRIYPVIGGIPRMLPDALFSTIVEYHPEFFAQRQHIVSSRNVKGALTSPREKKKETFKSFSYQWRTFDTMYEEWRENFLDYLSPLQPEFFKGKLGLDAGCGFGRHIYWAATFGAEMVGVDLSLAAEAARRNTLDMGNVHIVQGDIYALPFRPEAFDFAYSVGVLHHLPDPEKGFRSVVGHVRPGGVMSSWVYGPRYGPVEWISRTLRRVTTRMSFGSLHALCFLIAVFLRVFSHYPYLILSKVPVLRRAAECLPLKAHSRHPFSVTIADAFDRLSVPLVEYVTGDELKGWYARAGIIDVQVTRRMYNNESWRGNGKKPVAGG